MMVIFEGNGMLENMKLRKSRVKGPFMGQSRSGWKISSLQPYAYLWRRQFQKEKEIYGGRAGLLFPTCEFVIDG